MPSSIIPRIVEYKVSSVLNSDRKVYGKKFLFDGKDETCWNSDQGTPQWIHFTFDQPMAISSVKLQFQGGFAGKDCELGLRSTEDGHPVKSTKNVTRFTPQDNNSVQEFVFDGIVTGTDFYLKFGSSTDFYGRIILYNFDIFGDVDKC